MCSLRVTDQSLQRVYLPYTDKVKWDGDQPASSLRLHKQAENELSSHPQLFPMDKAVTGAQVDFSQALRWVSSMTYCDWSKYCFPQEVPENSESSHCALSWGPLLTPLWSWRRKPPRREREINIHTIPPINMELQDDYVCVCLGMSACISVFLHVHVYVHMCAHVRACVFACVCLRATQFQNRIC